MSSDVLVKVDGVSKKFCKSLKRSLWYGLCDMAHEVVPWGQPRSEVRDQRSEPVNPTSDLGLPTSDVRRPTSNSSSPALRKDEFWAVKDVSFELKRGECLGLIGHNGAGKSTLLKILNGLIKPDQGRVEMHGRIGALIELGAGFNPILTGRENIYNKGAILGFTKKEIDKKFDEIVDFAEIEDFIDMPVQNFSSGMKVRLGFAVSAQMDPDVLIIDEVLAVGDIGFRVKCLNRINELLKNSAVIFVSHSMPLVARSVSQVFLMNHGRQLYFGENVSKGIELYYDLFGVEGKSVDGSGKVRLDGITVSNLSDCVPRDKQKEYPSISQEDEITVNALVSADSEISTYSVVVVVVNKNLQQIASVFSRSDNFFIRNLGGQQLISVKFPNFFSLGTYTITVSFLEVTNEPLKPGEIYGSYRSVAGFKSEPTKRVVSHIPIQLRGEWEYTSKSKEYYK